MISNNKHQPCAFFDMTTKSNPKRCIDDVPAKFKQSELYKCQQYAVLMDAVIKYVLPFWNNKWRFNKPLSGIINKRSLSHELEESIPALNFVLQMMDDIVTEHHNNNKNDTLSIPIIDLCSGKGILSMLIISFIKLVPEYNSLCAYIQCIYLMDRSWNLNFMEVEEMKAQKADYTKQAKCPIKSEHLALLSCEFKVDFIAIRTNIHNKTIMEFIKKQSESSNHCKIILVSIHLCRRLSVRAIEIFNALQNVYGFLLAPCCLPLRGGRNIHIGPLWNKTYDLWNDANRANIDVNEQYLVKGITSYIAQTNDNETEFEMKHDVHVADGSELEIEPKCCFQLALLSQKEIHKRSKQLTNKYQLNQRDVSMLDTCEGNFDAIDVKNKENKILIVSEMIPGHLFDLEMKYRYNQWITFLFNGIDTNNNQKKIYRVPLTGNQHRCDAYLTVQRS